MNNTDIFQTKPTLIHINITFLTATLSLVFNVLMNDTIRDCNCRVLFKKNI